MIVDKILLNQREFDKVYRGSTLLYETSVYEFVDLGLPSGKKWCTKNIGATSPEDCGLYFSWGNIVGHQVVNEQVVDYSFDSTSYNSTPGKTLTGNIPQGDPVYDAATAICGSGWILPSQEDFQELIDNTSSEWTTLNGVNGYQFTNNGNSIFIPASGFCRGSSRNSFGDRGYVWSSSFNDSNNAYYLHFYEDNCSMGYRSRYYGLCARPIHTA